MQSRAESTALAPRDRRARIFQRFGLALGFAVIAQTAFSGGHWPQPSDVITPSGSGLLHTTEGGQPRAPMLFGAGFEAVLHTLLEIFGPDVDITFPSECSAGPLVSANFSNYITLTFQDDRLVGWMLIGDAQLRTDDGLGVGAAAGRLAGSNGVILIESSLGMEFDAGSVGGLLSEDGSHISAIWAGTNCIIR